MAYYDVQNPRVARQGVQHTFDISLKLHFDSCLILESGNT